MDYLTIAGLFTNKGQQISLFWAGTLPQRGALRASTLEKMETLNNDESQESSLTLLRDQIQNKKAK